MTKEEIIDLALRYITPGEVLDFPQKGDLFSLLMRELTPDRILKEEEGWGFGGYGICTNYQCDEETKPRGKWIWMHFTSLASFPPTAQVLKMQPPHIVKGRFQSADRSHEIRIVKVRSEDIGTPDNKENAAEPAKTDAAPKKSTKGGKGNIVAFRKK